MRILLIDNGTKYHEQLVKLLSDYQLVIRKMNDYNFQTEDVDVIILSGGHSYSIVDHQEVYKREITFIKKNLKPLLGICLGAELLGFTFGANLRRMEKKEKGIVKLEIDRDDGIFEGMSNILVYESHRWIIKELGRELIGLARSSDGYEIVKHKDFPFYGFQFHPEMLVDRTSGEKIFRNLIASFKNKD